MSILWPLKVPPFRRLPCGLSNLFLFYYTQLVRLATYTSLCMFSRKSSKDVPVNLIDLPRAFILTLHLLYHTWFPKPLSVVVWTVPLLFSIYSAVSEAPSVLEVCLRIAQSFSFLLYPGNYSGHQNIPVLV